MATENAPVPMRTGQPSQVAPVLDFSQWLAGSRTDTQARTTGQTAQLEAILAQIMAPGNLENIVANLFQQGAAQVPALTSQFANATGTRTSNNSMLSQSLALLNQQLAQAIAQAVAQQQQTAVQGAGQLAQATRTTQQTQKTQPGSLGRAVLPTVVGSVLNRIGKAQTPRTEAPAGEAPLPSFPAPTDYETGIPPQDFIPTPGVAEAGGSLGSIPSLDFVDFSAAASAAPDVGGMDYGYDYFDLPELDVADAFSDVGNLIDIDIPGWFRDGGMVRKYADGGQIRGRPNMGPRPAPQRTQAMQLHVPSQVTAAARRSPRQGAQADMEAPGPSAVAPNTSFASPAAIANISSMVSPANVSMGLTGLGLLGAPMSVVAAVAATKGIQMAVQQMLQEVFNLPIPPEEAMMPPAIQTMPPAILDPTIAGTVEGLPAANPSMALAMGEPEEGFTTEGSPAGPGVGGFDADTAAAIGAALGIPGFESFGEVGSADSGIGGFGDAEGIGATTGIGGESAEGGVGDGDGDGGGDGGVGGDGDGWADGGMVDRWGQKSTYIPRKPQPEKKKEKQAGLVKGAGTRTSDSILARVSVDEYILPASTVAAIGKHTLDQLVAATHTPVDEGTHG